MKNVPNTQLQLGTLLTTDNAVPNIAKQVFLMLSTPCLREIFSDQRVAEPKHMLRRLVATEHVTDPLLHLRSGQSGLSWDSAKETADDLAISAVTDAHHAGLGDGGMSHQALLDFSGKDVFTTCIRLVRAGSLRATKGAKAYLG